eukprot:Hpha_TRINITY_DN23631_c0_g1::TRINITY_DN23631_c0_g1_i1::g.57581::m.57581/K07127/uraH, pucM, hiuH; 5-hydroxyisourate hydrolase
MLRSAVLLALSAVVAADLRSPVTVHVLDTTKGQPAGGIPVSLYRVYGSDLTPISNGTTDVGGRADMLPLANFTATATDVNCCFDTEKLEPGVYRLTYYLLGYYSGPEQSFFPQLDVHFNVFSDKASQYYHVPVLLNNAGFTAYRGS